MTFAPVKLAWKWAVAGGRLSKPHGTDTQDFDTPLGTVSFVKLGKNADRLLKAVLCSTSKGALRRSVLSSTLGAMLTYAQADPASRWTRERAPGSSSPSAVAGAPSPAVAQSEPCDPMSQLQEISSENATPKKRKAHGAYKPIRGQTNIQTVIMPEYEPNSHPNMTE